jgi:hypothetical protein
MKTNYISNELLLLSLSNFYKDNTSKLLSILPIIYKSSHISLRLIDWFVTNYSKRYNVVLSKQNDIHNNSEYFNVYSSYRSQLKAFKKIQFDPFRRRERIDFYYKEGEFIETTIGQLNFFRWFVENKLLDYVEANYHDIESDMIHFQKEVDKTEDSQKPPTIVSSSQPSKVTKKRLHNTKTMIKHMTRYSGETTVNFA